MDRTRYDSQFTEDRLISCVECGHDFTFTAGEARFYRSKGLTIPPRRCPECRRNRKATINRDELTPNSENINFGRSRIPRGADYTTIHDCRS